MRFPSLRRGGFRTRLIVTVVLLVALTAGVLGIGAYAFVSASLRERLVADSVAQANFNIAILAAERLSAQPTPEEVRRSGLADAFRRRGEAETVVDFGDGDPFLSALSFRRAFDALSPELRRLVSAGRVAHQTVSVLGEPYLVVGGRRTPKGPDFYFFFPARSVEEALQRLAQGLGAGAFLLILVAIVAARSIARRVLRPVRQASAAAARIGGGDLGARVPAAGEDEFGAWAASFNRMAASLERTVDQLREAQGQQRRFVADVSHELRTPVTALVNEAAMIRDRTQGADPETRRLGELLVGDVARLRGLVADLMEVSRFDAAAERAHREVFDLSVFMRALLAARSPEARLELPSGPLPVVSDRRRLERIMGNLLDNAREHGDGAEVTLSCEMVGDEIVLRVADRGPGVEPADLAHLFDRFYKADASRGPGGSGLGLAIARQHAELLGASLQAKLRDGGGIIFELRFPVTGLLRGGDAPVTTAPDPDGRREHRGAPREGEGSLGHED